MSGEFWRLDEAGLVKAKADTATHVTIEAYRKLEAQNQRLYNRLQEEIGKKKMMQKWLNGESVDTDTRREIRTQSGKQLAVVVHGVGMVEAPDEAAAVAWAMAQVDRRRGDYVDARIGRIVPVEGGWSVEILEPVNVEP